MSSLEARNAHFDRLVAHRGLRWMGQNTNHLTPNPAVLASMLEVVERGEFNIYAPPLGLEELRSGITSDLGLPSSSAVVTDGGVAALYHLCHVLLRPGDELVTTDPTWNWPMRFASALG